VNGPISQRWTPLTVKLVVAVLLRKEPDDGDPSYQLIITLKVLDPPVLTCTEATYC
jgi:hypothetical protein